MTIRLSSALRTALVTNFGLGYLLQGGHIAFYSGAQPASANDAATGTLLGNITLNGLAMPTAGAPAGGLTVAAGDAGVLVNVGTWILKGVADGTFGWWRWSALAAPAGLSTAAYRLDGAAADSFATAFDPITPSTELAIPSFQLSYPAN
jgi:hypothetical protein